ncbi:hypothetical protein [Legionella maioricensis]|uniref:Uncharacterized protein n=1 Tax=Legionella maioricensis TaxID=2896528 RepID=A0A9X2D0T3_9GAMM|nr:hypothetical protein [Legionella maioricensis]MCL9683772.1 hypothetical protein [Legionella maioricensis]MCL9686619.1 hypothetical protein [Legionella maioricensis]
MSIYSCADRVKQALNNPVRPLEDEERLFLEDVKARLKSIGQEGYNESKQKDLGDLIECLRDYKANCSDPGLNKLFRFIIKDLTIVKDGRKQIHQSDDPNSDSETHRLKESPSEINEQYKALLNSRLLVNKLVQGEMKELGTSLGGCYGLTMSMADSDLSPYKNKGKEHIEFNKAIYKYQRNQSNREKDQKYIKTTRLTTKTFCPSLTQQAEKLYKIASEHVGEDLSVTLQCKHGRHGTYLSIQDDQKIRYADANHGVFLFDNKEQFISAYKLMNQYDNQRLPDYAFTFFSVSQLKEDKNNELTESNTLTGKWRSLLTGRKYESDSVISQLELAIPISFGALAGGAIGVVVGVAIGGLDPIGGLTTASIAGASIGSLATLDVVRTAQNNNHFGLLGPYHYLREKLHDLGESVKEKLGFQRECDEIPTMIIPESDSHSKILRSFCDEGMASPVNTQQNTTSEQANPSPQNSNPSIIQKDNADILIPDIPDETVDEGHEPHYETYSS